MIQHGNEKALVEFEGHVKLLRQLPDTVDELQEHGRSVRIQFLFTMSDALWRKKQLPALTPKEIWHPADNTEKSNLSKKFLPTKNPTFLNILKSELTVFTEINAPGA